MALSEIKTNIQKQEQNINPVQMVVKKSAKYTYTPMNKVKTIQQKWNTVDWPGEQRK